MCVRVHVRERVRVRARVHVHVHVLLLPVDLRLTWKQQRARSWWLRQARMRARSLFVCRLRHHFQMLGLGGEGGALRLLKLLEFSGQLPVTVDVVLHALPRMGGV
jgi:hypothetical protein